MERVIADSIDFIARFVPKQTYLCLPILSAVLVWAIKRGKDWKKEIFAWKVWLDPAVVRTKPDDFVLKFFMDNTALSNTFAKEIEERDFGSLRKAFRVLYPVVGLEDPFLQGLFHQELEAGEYRTILDIFDQRVGQAVKDIEPLEKKADFLSGLENLGKEIVSLGSELITQPDIRKKIAEMVKEQIGDTDE